MGLDVYLHQYHLPVDEARRLEDANGKKGEAIYDAITKRRGYAAFGDIPQSELEAYFAECKAAREEQGVREWEDTGEWHSQIRTDSAVYPKHQFKIGYMRSSYNDGGIDRILEIALGKRLDDIFPGDDYIRPANWAQALKMARQMRDDFSAWVAKNGAYRVTRVTPNMFGRAERISSAKQALARFQKELERWDRETALQDGLFTRYGCGDGEYMRDGMEIVAAINGVDTTLGWRPAVYLIERVKDEVSDVTGKPEGPYAWYQQALEIVVEMCDWVLEQERPERFLLHWSS